MSRSEQHQHEAHAATPDRLQVLRGADRFPDRAGAHRRGRPERLRQIEPGRGPALGHGRDLAQVHARRRHGRRDLLRLGQPPAAQHGRSRHGGRQFGAQGAGRVQRARDAGSLAPDRARLRVDSTASTAAKCARATCNCCSPMPRPGSRSPALVHQGRIGEIIQAKPEQRRRVLEEAAGVAGLHARRHEAELRLRAAEQNLARIEDVIGQLAAQVDALKRQARQAIRYRTVSAQVRKAEATLFHLRWVNAGSEVADAERARDLGVRARRRTHAGAGGGRDAAGQYGGRAAGAARGRGPRRRRAAPARARTRNARSRGSPRQGPYRRARSPARAARRGRKPRARAGGRRAGRARPARRGRGSARARGGSQRGAPRRCGRACRVLRMPRLSRWNGPSANSPARSPISMRAMPSSKAPPASRTNALPGSNRRA